MNHWAAGVAQVPDATAALEQYVAMLRTAGQETARRLALEFTYASKRLVD